MKWWLLVVMLAGCSLTQPATVEQGDERWWVVCRVFYTSFGRSTTVYLRVEPNVLTGHVTIDDQCRVTIDAQ